MGRIDYDGRPEFSRPRSLTETETIEQFSNRLERTTFLQDPRSEATDNLFNNLAVTYLKGNVLKKGLSEMDPAQFIPIETDADTVSAAAVRMSDSESLQGTVITYGMYQTAIDRILEKKWQLRHKYLKIDIPASSESVSRQTVSSVSNGSGNSLIEQFLAENGVAATIIGMLTLSPFQTIIFQALSGEESAAKGVQVAQIPMGIALMLELGIKADRIRQLLKSAKIETPLVEQQIAQMENSPSARAAALEDAGIDYEDFKKSQHIQDAEKIVDYVSDFYMRYGGLNAPNGHLSIDHWLAYSHVAQNQQTIRGALNTSETFSPQFKKYRNQYSTTNPPTTEDSNTEETSKIFVQLASATRALKENSNDIYDDIIRTFNYQITDQDLCCLVQIFEKSLGSPKSLHTIASLLRILATDLSGEIVRIHNLVTKFLGNLLQDSLFEVTAQINEFYYKIVHKITQAFTIEYENIEACGGMLSIGWAIMHSVRVLFEEVNALIKEISSIIGDYGTPMSGSWKISADRRFLVGTARVLEVLADRIDLANNCAPNKTIEHSAVLDQISDPNLVVDQAIFSIIESREPVLNISEEDKKNYFPDVQNIQSDNLKFNYGIYPEQNNEEASNCQDSQHIEKIQKLASDLSSALNNIFNG